MYICNYSYVYTHAHINTYANIYIRLLFIILLFTACWYRKVQVWPYS